MNNRYLISKIRPLKNKYLCQNYLIARDRIFLWFVSVAWILILFMIVHCVISACSCRVYSTGILPSLMVKKCWGFFSLRRQLNRYASLICHRILCRACSAVVTYHGRLVKYCQAKHNHIHELYLLHTKIEMRV